MSCRFFSSPFLIPDPKPFLFQDQSNDRDVGVRFGNREFEETFTTNNKLCGVSHLHTFHKSSQTVCHSRVIYDLQWGGVRQGCLLLKNLQNCFLCMDQVFIKEYISQKPLEYTNLRAVWTIFRKLRKINATVIIEKCEVLKFDMKYVDFNVQYYQSKIDQVSTIAKTWWGV